MSNKEIVLDNIGMTYKTNDGKDVTALTGVSLDINKGEFISLLGPSGCGKTTLLRIIADLLQPTQGTITVGGETPRQARLKQRYGIVFQSAVLYDWHTVKKNVMLPLEIMHVPKEQRAERAEKMLELVGLTDFAEHYPNQLIISGTVTSRSECYAELKAALEKAGVSYAEFTDIHGEPTDVTVNAALNAYREGGCDCFAAIGGGSALDTMKAAAVLAANGGKISDYMGKIICGELPFMAAIPTTAGTGSEATRFTVITDTATDIKMLLNGAPLIPDLAVLDPKFTVSAPKSVTAATGLDALTHAIESYTSKKAQPLTDVVALSAVKRIFKSLPAAYKDGNDLCARSEMALAALEAGIAINNASVTIVHGMSRPIGANFHVPHGISNAMLLEKCLSFALDGAYPKFAELGRAIGAATDKDDDKEASEKLIGAVHELCGVCEVPTLEKYGIDKEKFFASMDKMASDALASGSPSNTIKPVTKEDIMTIYRDLW